MLVKEYFCPFGSLAVIHLFVPATWSRAEIPALQWLGTFARAINHLRTKDTPNAVLLLYKRNSKRQSSYCRVFPRSPQEHDSICFGYKYRLSTSQSSWTRNQWPSPLTCFALLAIYFLALSQHELFSFCAESEWHWGFVMTSF